MRNKNDDVIAFNTTHFNKHCEDVNIGKQIEYLKIQFVEQYRYDSQHQFNSLNFLEKKVPIYFISDLNDNLKLKDIDNLNFDDIYNEKLQIVEFLNEDNIVCDICDISTIDFNHILYVNLNKNDILRRKIYSHDYRLFIFFKDGYFVIRLIYSPNMRKYKLQQLNKIDDL